MACEVFDWALSGVPSAHRVTVIETGDAIGCVGHSTTSVKSDGSGMYLFVTLLAIAFLT